MNKKQLATIYNCTYTYYIKNKKENIREILKDIYKVIEDEEEIEYIKKYRENLIEFIKTNRNRTFIPNTKGFLELSGIMEEIEKW